MTKPFSPDDISDFSHFARTIPPAVAAINGIGYLTLANGIIGAKGGDVGIYLVGGLGQFALGILLGGASWLIFWIRAMIGGGNLSLLSNWFREGVSRIRRTPFDVTPDDVREYLKIVGVALTVLGMISFGDCLLGSARTSFKYVAAHSQVANDPKVAAPTASAPSQATGAAQPRR
jgi:hypothetical protein